MKPIAEMIKPWWQYLHGYGDNWVFWSCLTDGMCADHTRSPWEMMQSANLANDFCEYYADWSLGEIYSLFCDEERYHILLDRRDIEQENELESSYIEATTTYNIEGEGRNYAIFNVPVRISVKTGEKFYSPKAVQLIQSIIYNRKNIKRLALFNEE